MESTQSEMESTPYLSEDAQVNAKTNINNSNSSKTTQTPTTEVDSLNGLGPPVPPRSYRQPFMFTKTRGHDARNNHTQGDSHQSMRSMLQWWKKKIGSKAAVSFSPMSPLLPVTCGPWHQIHAQRRHDRLITTAVFHVQSTGQPQSARLDRRVSLQGNGKVHVCVVGQVQRVAGCNRSCTPLRWLYLV